MSESLVLIASSPQNSCWVSASAGSGKTTILIQRILRLLIEGATLDSILCLTYTNAAAAEMKERLLKRASDFNKLSEEKLEEELVALQGCEPTPTELKNAKNLYTTLVSNIDALKIQTIHSFCKNLISKLPYESGIFGDIEILSIEKGSALLKETIEECLPIGADFEEKSEFQKSFNFLSQHMFFDQINDHLISLLDKRYELSAFLKQYNKVDYENFLKNKFKVVEENFEGGREWNQEKFNEISLKKSAQNIFDFLNSFNDIPITSADYKFLSEILKGDYNKAFLTNNLSLRKKILNLSIQKKYKEEYENIRKQAEAFYNQFLHSRVNFIIQETLAFIEVSKEIFQKYKEKKIQYNLYDFEDLIMIANELFSNALSDPVLKESIFSKILVKHIFVDEAQDTSLQQWHVILKMVELYFSSNSSIFVVGDVKQSIYSFQGARPWIFVTLEEIFKKIVKKNGGKWKSLTIKKSYRSSAAILEVVDLVFQKSVLAKKYPYENHISNRSERGWVEVINVSGEKENKEENIISSKEEALAEETVLCIQNLLSKQIFLPSVKRCIKPSDIFVLTRRRGSFISLLIEKCQKIGVPYSDPDKLKIVTHMLWADLLAFAKFLIFPEDDYNLACLLKSPFVGFTEEELFIVCYKRPSTIFERIFASSSTKEEVKFTTEKAKNDSILRKLENIKKYKIASQRIKKSTDFFDFFYRVLAEVTEKFEAEFGNLTTRIFEVFLQTLQKFLIDDNENFYDFLSKNKPEDNSAVLSEGVRFLTIHGAKGLQAPIVIYVDVPSRALWYKEKFIWFSENFSKQYKELKYGIEKEEEEESINVAQEENLLIMPPANISLESFERLRKDCEQKNLEEEWRLLYVAMTRAQDGFYSIGSLEESGWHKVIFEATTSWKNKKNMHKENLLKNEDAQNLFRENMEERVRNNSAPEIGAWGQVKKNIIREKSIFKANLESKQAVLDSSDNKLKNLALGILLHHLIKVVAHVNIPTNFIEKLRIICKNEIINIEKKCGSALKFSDAEITECIEKILKIMKMNEFQWLQKGVSEVSLLSEGVMFRLDHLYVDEKNAIIIEVKSSSNSLKCLNDIPEKYLEQLYNYYHIIKNIFPQKRIIAYLLWVEGQNFIKVKDSFEIAYENS